MKDKEQCEMLVYHTGYQVIEKPDVHYGRKNADFGQGFYVSSSRDFSARWIHPRRGSRIFINSYRLFLSGLRVRTLDRDEEWFRYLFANRHHLPDVYDEDVIRGPIANDTIFDTLGIITSGQLADEDALKLLMVGPAYEQIVLKTEKAAGQLTFLSAEEIPAGEYEEILKVKKAEEDEYLSRFVHVMEKIY
ncbi:MAG: DUF3990 domain-containing protein [Solobacterium sp.]|nr:DUF3990 domain-containing protein [Solobacterium sp.]